MHLTTFAWRYATHHFCAVGERLLRMKRALLASKTLTKHLGVLIN
jgi:hypothetical protein